MADGSLAFGITGGARPWFGALAAEVERLGYVQLWANDTPGHAGLDALAEAATVTGELQLAVGVLGLSEWSPTAIAERVARLQLPSERLIIGLGSGRSRSVAIVEDGVAEVRRRLPEVRIVVAALGPRMLAMAGRVADGVLLNWSVPERIGTARATIREAAAAAGRPAPWVAAYVRVAIGPGARDRLRAEMDRYRRTGPWYAKTLDEQADAQLIGAAAGSAAELAPQLAAYRGALDVTVVRALAECDELDAWRAVAGGAGRRTFANG
ncbi:MAG: LLM class flavin-dependent oxidoreductase [Candidatus Limnocylindria bacterium]